MPHKDPEARRAYEKKRSQTQHRRESKRASDKAYRESNISRLHARSKVYRETHKEHIQAKKQAYHLANRTKILQGKKSAYRANRAQILEQQKSYRLANTDSIHAYQQAYKAKNRALLQAKSRAYYHANKNKVRAYRNINKTKIKARYAAYWITHKEELSLAYQARCKAHPEYGRLKSANRKARKRGAVRRDLTRAQWLAIQAAQDHRCAYCGTRCKDRLTQDHITPLSKGGSHTLHNVIGACASCNSKKYTGPPLVPVQPLLL